MGLEGGFRAPCIIRWPGRVQPGTVQNGIMSGLDWFPTFVAAAGNPNIAAELRQGKDDRRAGPIASTSTATTRPDVDRPRPSARNEIFYFTESTLAAVRIGDYKYRFTDQPQGWLGGTVKLDWPMIVNLRLDPFERMGMPSGANGSLNFYSFYIHEFWRFVFVQQEVARYAETFVAVPADAARRLASTWKR